MFPNLRAHPSWKITPWNRKCYKVASIVLGGSAHLRGMVRSVMVDVSPGYTPYEVLLQCPHIGSSNPVKYKPGTNDPLWLCFYARMLRLPEPSKFNLVDAFPVAFSDIVRELKSLIIASSIYPDCLISHPLPTDARADWRSSDS